MTGAAVNQAFAAAPDADVLLLNPDVAVTDAGQIEDMRDLLARQPRAAVVAPKLLEPDGSVRIPEVLQPYIGKEKIERR